MMSLAGKLKVIEKLAIDNSPVILTAIGVAGTIGTAILAHRAGTKARRIMDDVQIEFDNHPKVRVGVEELSKKETFKLVWIAYIPPVVSGAATVGAIVMANHIGTKRAAALAAAYTISEKAYTEYREKVIERIGEKDERDMRNSIVQDRVRQMPPSEANVLMVGGGDHLFMEMYTGRYFRSDMQAVKKAVNEINFKINAEGYASVSDFYDILELPHTSVSDEMGWNRDKLMDVNYDPVLSDTGQPCVGISFMTGPVRDYFRFHQGS